MHSDADLMKTSDRDRILSKEEAHSYCKESRTAIVSRVDELLNRILVTTPEDYDEKREHRNRAAKAYYHRARKELLAERRERRRIRKSAR